MCFLLLFHQVLNSWIFLQNKVHHIHRIYWSELFLLKGKLEKGKKEEKERDYTFSPQYHLQIICHHLFCLSLSIFQHGHLLILKSLLRAVRHRCCIDLFVKRLISLNFDNCLCFLLGVRVMMNCSERWEEPKQAAPEFLSA